MCDATESYGGRIFNPSTLTQSRQIDLCECQTSLSYSAKQKEEGKNKKQKVDYITLKLST